MNESGAPITAQPETLPLVSLCVAMRNEEAYIGECLDSILNQTYPQNKIEVFVVDGLSTDQSVEIVTRYAKRYPNIHLLTNHRQITPVAFNLGIKQAKGEFIGIASSHATLHPDYITLAIRYAYETGTDHIGGVNNAISQTMVGQAIAIATSSPFGVGGARFRYATKPGYVDTVFMGLYRKEVFARIGLFDEELVRNQDDEFNYRLNAAGGNHYLHPDIITTYYNRTTFKSLWKQYFQYGEWKVRVAQKVPDQIKPRHLIPFGFCCFLFGGGALALVVSGLRLLWAFGLTLYVLTNLLVSFTLALRNGWRYFFLLPPAFLTLHLSYGLGFAKGLFRFGKYWFNLKPQYFNK